MAPTESSKQDKANASSHAWRWVLVITLLAVVTLLLAARILLARAEPILRGRLVETLQTRFNSRVELDALHISIAHDLGVTGGGLRIYPSDDVVAAGATAPLIVVESFQFRASLLGLFRKPTHVGSVHVRGLEINIPPREMRTRGRPKPAHRGKVQIVVDNIVCDDSELVIGTSKPDKDPKIFRLKHIVLDDVGPLAPWRYDAVLTNAVPTGDIHAVGSFGPWKTESPGDSAVTGDYTFDHADLGTIRGIGGILHSVGQFSGQLNRIAVQGSTQVPDFSLDSANHPMPLETRFSAIVDGTTGDTYLQPVDARLGESVFSCRGTVINVKGKGHIIDLDVDVPAGRIQDFLALSVKTQPPILSGIIQTRAKLHIRPGKERVVEKLGMRGRFRFRDMNFTTPAIQDKVDMLSLRAEGEPERARSGAPNVQSRMEGTYIMSAAKLRFPNLNYDLPGGTVRLTGIYSLDGQQFEFTGKVRTDAKISQMVASKWKSLLLKPIDPFFHKRGAGSEIPVKISGTREAPHFGLDLKRKK